MKVTGGVLLCALAAVTVVIAHQAEPTNEHPGPKAESLEAVFTDFNPVKKTVHDKMLCDMVVYPIQHKLSDGTYTFPSCSHYMPSKETCQKISAFKGSAPWSKTDCSDAGEWKGGKYGNTCVWKQGVKKYFRDIARSTGCAICPVEEPHLTGVNPISGDYKCRSLSRMRFELKSAYGKTQAGLLGTCLPRDIMGMLSSNTTSCVKAGIRRSGTGHHKVLESMVLSSPESSRKCKIAHSIRCLVTKQVFCSKKDKMSPRVCTTIKRVEFDELAVDWIGCSKQVKTVRRRRAKGIRAVVATRGPQLHFDKNTMKVQMEPSDEHPTLGQLKGSCAPFKQQKLIKGDVKKAKLSSTEPHLIPDDICKSYWKEVWPKIEQYHREQGLCTLIAITV